MTPVITTDMSKEKLTETMLAFNKNMQNYYNFLFKGIREFNNSKPNEDSLKIGSNVLTNLCNWYINNSNTIIFPEIVISPLYIGGVELGFITNHKTSIKIQIPNDGVIMIIITTYGMPIEEPVDQNTIMNKLIELLIQYSKTPIY